MTAALVHERVCAGPLECGGYVRCRACGRRFGWCRGVSNDHGCCPECYPDLDAKPPQFRFRPLEVSLERGPDGRFVAKADRRAGAPR